MPDIVIGNSASYDGLTATAAELASIMGSTYASASSGALTLKSGQGIAVSNADSNNPLFIRSGASNMPMVAGGTISANQEEYVIDVQGLFSTALTINSGVYLYAAPTGTALTINVPATITNNGYILGGGGNGSSSSKNAGHAIEIASGTTGVSITNASGAYIAGGGGGGSIGRNGGGGGGAGGGDGGGAGGAGGAPGSSGSDGSDPNNSGCQGGGGGTGGGGAGCSFNGTAGGGGGGRVINGTGGYRGNRGASNYGYGGAGGSGTSAGAAAGYGGTDSAGRLDGCGGGGGWAATGGSSRNLNSALVAGGTAGKAVEDNGVTYTLSNSGTIYGAT